MADDGVGIPDAEGVEPQAPPTGQPEGQAEEFQVPEGRELVDAKEWTRLRQLEQTHKGVAPLAHKGLELGFKTPDDLAQARQTLDLLKKNGIDPNNIGRLFGSGTAEKESDPNERFSQYEKQLDELRSETRRNAAIGPHREQEVKSSKLIEDAASELAGDSETNRKLYAQYLRSQVGSELYPEDHPLYGEFLVPATQEAVEKAVAQMREDLGLDAAREVLDAGRATNKAKPSAGGRAGQGGATKDAKDPPDPLDMDDDEARAGDLAALKKVRSMRGGTVGSLQG